jgi:hypothetical protein
MFSGLVMRLLAKDPDDRPQTAREVVEAIEALERGEPEEEVVEIEVCRTEENASPPAPAAEERGRKRDGARPKRPRVRRKKKRPRIRRDWGPWVLAAGATLLVVAVVALILVLIHSAR